MSSVHRCIILNHWARLVGAQRDAGLNAPRLLYQSVQVNIDGGIMPRVLRIPLNVFPKSLEAQVRR
ncbi:MAG: hypothetical protein ACI9U2_003202 [Bradymonadia bacterium]